MKIDPVGDPELAGLGFERLAARAFADDEQVGVGDGAQDLGPGLEQRRVALLRLEPGDDADELRARLHAVFLGQRAARLLVVVARQVDAVVDAPDRRGRASFVDELALDHLGDRDELVDVRRQLAQELAVLLGADAARVDGRDDVRPALADLGEGHRCAGADGLGPEHVVVDDLRALLGEVRGQRADGDRVVRLVDDEHREARLLELADGTPRGERHDRDVVAAVIHAGHERVQVLLRAAVGAGREDLDDADASAADERRALDDLEAGIRRGRGAHRASRRRTSRRWIGSSTAPHSYL